MLSIYARHIPSLGPFTRRLTTTASSLASSKYTNPANFANRPHDEVSEIGRRGGQKGGRARGRGGFHDMDPQKQREIASKGGHASSGKFHKGSERAREAGRKGGHSRGRSPFDEW